MWKLCHWFCNSDSHKLKHATIFQMNIPPFPRFRSKALKESHLQQQRNLHLRVQLMLNSLLVSFSFQYSNALLALKQYAVTEGTKSWICTWHSHKIVITKSRCLHFKFKDLLFFFQKFNYFTSRFLEILDFNFRNSRFQLWEFTTFIPGI